MHTRSLKFMGLRNFFFQTLMHYDISYDTFSRDWNVEVFDLDISAVKNPVDFGGTVNQLRSNSGSQSVANTQIENTGNVTDTPVTDQTGEQADDSEKVTQMTEMMNKFVQAMDADIQFKIHEGTQQLMVQVVDQANNKVLKEFPSSEFLDTIAAIRDFVGILLDKKV